MSDTTTPPMPPQYEYKGFKASVDFWKRTEYMKIVFDPKEHEQRRIRHRLQEMLP
jgi:hypothetical protein